MFGRPTNKPPRTSPEGHAVRTTPEGRAVRTTPEGRAVRTTPEGRAVRTTPEGRAVRTKIILTGHPPPEQQIAGQVRSATGMTYGVQTADGARMPSAVARQPAPRPQPLIASWPTPPPRSATIPPRLATLLATSPEGRAARATPALPPTLSAAAPPGRTPKSLARTNPPSRARLPVIAAARTARPSDDARTARPSDDAAPPADLTGPDGRPGQIMAYLHQIEQAGGRLPTRHVLEAEFGADLIALLRKLHAGRHIDLWRGRAGVVPGTGHPHELAIRITGSPTVLATPGAPSWFAWERGRLAS
ncbi:hypothetical protein [Rhodopila sp.]|uniref:hypothetical protein n=1 Tax=Rhodopila sp. TaxID=2480087 RepID=UPI003D0A37FA